MENETQYCDNYLCEAEAVKEVSVSVKKYEDETRNFCATCEEAYTIGVQHGKAAHSGEVGD